MKPLAGAVLVLCLAISASARADVTGQYTGTWGATSLVQVGDHVTGTYAHSDGRIDGVLDGTVLRFTWQERRGSGHGVFIVARGELIGTWGNGDDDHSSGVWRLTPAPVAAPATMLPCIPPQATLPATRRSVLGFDITIPWDTTVVHGAHAIGLAGLGVAVGARITPRWYVGGTADGEMLMVFAPSSASNPAGLDTIGRERLGGEIRYTFEDAASPVLPSFGHRKWIGLRGGIETVDSATTFGRFADVTLGRDSQLAGVALGIYVSLGVSFEAAGAYTATTTSMPPATPAVASNASAPLEASPYLALGMRLGF
jgi:hypothetical protein